MTSSGNICQKENTNRVESLSEIRIDLGDKSEGV